MSKHDYLLSVLAKFAPKNLLTYSASLSNLQHTLLVWSAGCSGEIIESGSRKKGTAIAYASDVDYMVSLSSDCDTGPGGGMSTTYSRLYQKLSLTYGSVSRQNVSVRVNLNGLEVDVTPARKHSGNSHYHWIYVSKKDSIQQTNVQMHIKDVSESGRLNEIRLLKIWRHVNNLDFPSIYLEYLLIQNILHGKSKNANDLVGNFWHVITSLAQNISNPLYSRIPDPANSNNILSDLLDENEKKKIILVAQRCLEYKVWGLS